MHFHIRWLKPANFQQLGTWHKRSVVLQRPRWPVLGNILIPCQKWWTVKLSVLARYVSSLMCVYSNIYMLLTLMIIFSIRASSIQSKTKICLDDQQQHTLDPCQQLDKGSFECFQISRMMKRCKHINNILSQDWSHDQGILSNERIHLLMIR